MGWSVMTWLLALTLVVAVLTTAINSAPVSLNVSDLTTTDHYESNDIDYTVMAVPTSIPKSIRYNIPTNANRTRLNGMTYYNGSKRNYYNTQHEATYLLSTPIIMLILVTLVILLFSHPRSMFTTEPVVNIQVSMEQANVDVSTYPHCRGQVVDTNSCLMHFLGNLTESTPSKGSQQCVCCPSGKCQCDQQTHLPPEATVPFIPTDPMKTQAAAAAVEKKDASTSITPPDSDSSSDSYSDESSDEESRETSETSTDEDSPMVIDINPFDPEYVYAALAPDFQPMDYPLTNKMINERVTRSIMRLPPNPRAPSKNRRVSFAIDSSLETIYEYD